jgi:hypothetical protein
MAMSTGDGQSPAQRAADGAGHGWSRIIAAALLGIGYFVVVEAALRWLAGRPLPAGLLSFWIEYPRIGTLAVSGYTALLSHWLVAAAVGLIVASVARRDFLFHGAIAVGAYLVCNTQLTFEGLQSMFQIGPDFWLALKVDAARTDPFGMLSRWLALPLCTWLWGNALFGRDTLHGSGT